MQCVFCTYTQKRGTQRCKNRIWRQERSSTRTACAARWRIQPWADDAAFLLGFRTFYIDGAPVHVAHSRVHKGMLVVKFQGVDDVNAAMTMKNRVVSIARADVTLPDGQYFQQDLLGIAVETDAGETIGTLREILDLPRGSVYVVQGDREVLIPDRPEFVRSIDTDAGRMVVHLIEGM